MNTLPSKPSDEFLAWAAKRGMDVYQPYGHLQSSVTAAAWAAWQAARSSPETCEQPTPPDYLLDADIQAQGIEGMTHEIKRLRAENTSNRLLAYIVHAVLHILDDAEENAQTGVVSLEISKDHWAELNRTIELISNDPHETLHDIIKVNKPPTVPASCLANVIKHNDAAIDLVIERGTRIAELEAEVLHLSETLPYCPHCDCDYCGAVKGRLER